MKKIVVLDGFTLNPGDLDWTELEKLGELTVYDRTPPELVIERAGDAELILINKIRMTEEVLEKLPSLRYIGVLATGYDVVDIAAARKKGVAVTNVPEYATDSVGQMVFAHLLNLTFHAAEHSASVKNGDWSSSKDFCYWNYPLVELSGLTFGVIGCGRTGLAALKAAKAFGMKTIAFSRSSKNIPGVEMVSLGEVFKRSDVLSLHCPLTADTAGIVSESRLKLMKPSAFLINTGRGPLIDEVAVAEALNSDRIAGAGVDVVSSEPISKDNPLLTAKNCYITPHIAWATLSARKRLLNIATENVKVFIEGKVLNRLELK